MPLPSPDSTHADSAPGPEAWRCSEPGRSDELTAEEKIVREEYRRIRQRREVAFDPPTDPSTGPSSNDKEQLESHPSPNGSNSPEPLQDVVGLALSGGGLRSAVFNHGFLQGLSHRGVLRYVDYLSSVSGGGYIAGHLATRGQEDPSAPKPFYADHEVSDTSHTWSNGRNFTASHASDSATRVRYQADPAWHLGRDPKTGQVDPRYLFGIGRYLSGLFRFAPAHTINFLINALVYLGMVGILATAAALFWRSFDAPPFRYLLERVLEVRYGGEVLIAFYPTMLCGLIWIGLMFARATAAMFASRWVGTFDRLLRPMQWVVGASVLISVAVALGNGRTTVTRSGDNEFFLNQYAEYLAVIAGTIQIFAFLGRDRLFRSQNDEAATWQRTLQRVITYTAVLAMLFAMVHWMAREDISHFNQRRGPFLVVGDVNDWAAAEQLMQFHDNRVARDGGRATWERTAVESLEPLNREIREGVVHADPWQRHIDLALLSGGWPDPLYAPSDPPSPLVVHGQNADRPSWYSFPVAQAYLATHCPVVRPWCNASLIEAMEHHEKTLWRQSQWIGRFNERLDDPELTTTLLRATAASNELAYSTKATWSHQLGPVEVTNEVRGEDMAGEQIDAVRTRLGKPSEAYAKSALSADQRRSILHRAQRHELNQLTPSTPLRDASPTRSRQNIAVVNRQLIELMLPELIRSRIHPSTLVVPPHDQRARLGWMVTWLFLLTAGLLLNLMRRYLPTTFNCYRDQLRSHFLNHLDAEPSDPMLADLEPTRVGLPHPIFLASRTHPVVRDDRYRVDHRVFAMTPLYCGSLHPGPGQTPPIDPADLRLKSDGGLRLSEAITLSAAAVTPFMTGNRALSFILNFFGTGLGCWIRREESKKSSVQETMAQEATEERSNVDHAPQAAVPNSWPWLDTLPILFLFVAVVVSVWGGFFGGKSPLVWGGLTIASLVEWLTNRRPGGVVLTLDRLLRPTKDSDVGDEEPHRRQGIMGHVADGGFYDYLGATELLRRRCDLIIVSDAGAHLGDQSLGTLAKLDRRLAETWASVWWTRITTNRSISNGWRTTRPKGFTNSS